MRVLVACEFSGMPPSKNRGKLRSITYIGIPEVMAGQWGRKNNEN
jgi:hypothetical protein